MFELIGRSPLRLRSGSSVGLELAYFVDPSPSAHENSRSSSFGGDAFR